MSKLEIQIDKLPQYGQCPKKPGMYLGLFHGRDEPQQQMQEWGYHGPTIGPLNWCHTTYALDVKIEFEKAEGALVYSADGNCQQVLVLSGDMLTFGGKFFGDWTLYCVSP